MNIDEKVVENALNCIRNVIGIYDIHVVLFKIIPKLIQFIFKLKPN